MNAANDQAARDLALVEKVTGRDLHTSPISEGDAALRGVYDYLGRFVAYPSEAAHVAHLLWIAHAHKMDRWDSTPRIAFLSPEPASGKSRALEVTEPFVPRPVEAVNVTPAYLFRKVADPQGAPTILFDEIDTVFGPRAKENEEIRGLLNAGHRRGAVAGRCVVHGKLVLTEEIPAYCAVALAGLGALPDTILSRCVVVRMRRRSPHEKIEPYRRRINGKEGEALRGRLAAWLKGAQLKLSLLPAGIEDRDADIWEALLAIADAAGGKWPERARQAAKDLIAESHQSTPSLGIQLLADLKKVFTACERLPTVELLQMLHEMEDAPWSDLHGKPLDSRGLSYRLKAYGIAPGTVRIGEKTPRGYKRADFLDAWTRYLPSVAPESKTSETSTTTGAEGTITAETSATTGGVSETSPPPVARNVAHVVDVLDLPATHGAADL